jgi:hypothetical protein
MPCVNYTVMGSATNLVLTPNCFAAYEVMNKFVALESKKQHISSSFILQFNFNKLEASFSFAHILAMKPPWRINLLWAMHSLTQGGLGQSFTKCPLLSQLKHLTLD